MKWWKDNMKIQFPFMETMYEFWRKHHCFLSLCFIKLQAAWRAYPLTQPFRTQARECRSLSHWASLFGLTWHLPPEWGWVGTDAHEGFILCWAQSSPRKSCRYPHVADETHQRGWVSCLNAHNQWEDQSRALSPGSFGLQNARFSLYTTILGPYLTCYN